MHVRLLRLQAFKHCQHATVVLIPTDHESQLLQPAEESKPTLHAANSSTGTTYLQLSSNCGVVRWTERSLVTGMDIQHPQHLGFREKMLWPACYTIPCRPGSNTVGMWAIDAPARNRWQPR